MKTHVIDMEDFKALNWNQRPRDAGQMVDIQYASDGDWLYCRRHDRSADTITMSCRRIVDSELDRDAWEDHIPKTTGDEHTVLVD